MSIAIVAIINNTANPTIIINATSPNAAYVTVCTLEIPAAACALVKVVITIDDIENIFMVMGVDDVLHHSDPLIFKQVLASLMEILLMVILLDILYVTLVYWNSKVTPCSIVPVANAKLDKNTKIKKYNKCFIILICFY